MVKLHPFNRQSVAALKAASPRWTVMAVTLWGGAVFLGLAMMWSYASTPADESATTSHWPGTTKMQLDATRDTLVVFVHPQCPCTRATIGELEKIVARSPGGLGIWVVFYRPLDEDSAWAKTDLWRTAEQIPGVGLVEDPGGNQARLFGATTSGQAMLFTPKGEVLFKGGITAARGHEGDNAGSDTITDFVLRGTSAIKQTPVFGCSILDSATAKSK